MKKMILAIATLAIVFFAACEKTEVAAPSFQNVAPEKVEATNSFTTATEQTTASARAVAAAPTFASFRANNTSVLAYKWCTNGTDWKPYLVTDIYESSYFTLSGDNFGSTKGTVELVGANDYSVSDITWATNGKSISFRIRPKSTGAAPVTGANVRITLPNNSATRTTTGGYSFIPYAKTRQYHQCTWWTTIRRIDKGLSVQSTAYTTSGSLDANYIPQSNDILIWGTSASGHVAYLESCVITEKKDPSGYPKGTIEYTYTMSVSEYNINPCEGFGSFSKTVKVRKAPNGTRAIFEGNYKHPLVSNYALTGYYR
jgi:hypothetical protein